MPIVHIHTKMLVLRVPSYQLSASGNGCEQLRWHAKTTTIARAASFWTDSMLSFITCFHSSTVERILLSKCISQFQNSFSFHSRPEYDLLLYTNLLTALLSIFNNGKIHYATVRAPIYMCNCVYQASVVWRTHPNRLGHSRGVAQLLQITQHHLTRLVQTDCRHWSDWMRSQHTIPLREMASTRLLILPRYQLISKAILQVY